MIPDCFLLMVTLCNFRYSFPVFMEFLCDMVKFDHNLQRMMSSCKHLRFTDVMPATRNEDHFDL